MFSFWPPPFHKIDNKNRTQPRQIVMATRRNATVDTKALLRFHSERGKVTLIQGAEKILKFTFWNLEGHFRLSLGHLQASEVAQDRGAAQAPGGRAIAGATCHKALPEVATHVKGLFERASPGDRPCDAHSKEHQFPQCGCSLNPLC